MSHVTSEQRYTIDVMLKQGYRQNEIAMAIGKCKSVISRELKRNCDDRNGKYRSELASRKCKGRHKMKPKKIRFTKEVEQYVNKKLNQEWSPEQISNTPNKKGLDMVSPERIYQHILRDRKKGGQLYKKKRRQKKYRSRLRGADTRGKIKNTVNISQRPPIVDNKGRVGDFEVDLVIGANHKGALVTINERRTGYTKVKHVKSKNSKTVAKAIIRALKPIKEFCHTITSDNGKEFADHELISKELEIDFYFADPYSSWQRGANENFNGLLRQYFPKKKSFEQLSWYEVQKAEDRLNNRPRKRLGFQTPNFLFNKFTKVAFVA